MNQKTIADFVGLLKSAVEAKPCCGRDIDWREILRLSSFHRVDNLIYEAIFMLPEDEKPSEKALADLEQDSLTQVIQDANQISETEELMNELEQNQIPAIMLKGWIMKDIYPRTDLRSRADTDVFIHASDEEKVHHIIRSHGYKTISYGGKKDNVYSKEPFMTLEMHKNLFEYEDDWNDVINNKYGRQYIWKRIEKLDGYPHIYRMDREFYYVYMVAHMAKHLKDDGGIGVRAFMDLWIYRKAHADSLDTDVMHADFEALGLTTFAEKAYTLACSWFDGDTINYPDESYQKFTEYIMDCGAYGNSDNFVINNEAMRGDKKPGSKGYILKRAFPPRESMEKRYPALKKHPVRLPYYWAKRLWYSGVHRRDAVKGEIESAKNIDYDKVNTIHEMYQDWGLLSDN